MLREMLGVGEWASHFLYVLVYEVYLLALCSKHTKLLMLRIVFWV